VTGGAIDFAYFTASRVYNPSQRWEEADSKQATQSAEKLKFLSFRGALRAEESLFSCV